ncbi:MAG: hypothetical protein Unbinned400contig1002_20 [Prokaryotic dsDNA virus sp.]|nr:MAG: hypothetical protein Unbinned400contig1002_20 [Prokaryotic dsDNA virus sp.]|tara:strand:+ start:14119 stop:14727 length:609 start_codon:yes stop_codon:yes gene_type:complete
MGGTIYTMVCIHNRKVAAFGCKAGPYMEHYAGVEHQLMSGEHPNKGLQSDFDLYGSSGFKIRFYESVHPDDVEKHLNALIVSGLLAYPEVGYHQAEKGLMPKPRAAVTRKRPSQMSEVDKLKADVAAMKEVVGSLGKKKKKKTPFSGREVIRMEGDSEVARYSSITAAAKAAKSTTKDMRAAIESGKKLKKSTWLFADAETN